MAIATTTTTTTRTTKTTTTRTKSAAMAAVSTAENGVGSALGNVTVSSAVAIAAAAAAAADDDDGNARLSVPSVATESAGAAHSREWTMRRRWTGTTEKAGNPASRERTCGRRRRTLSLASAPSNVSQAGQVEATAAATATATAMTRERQGQKRTRPRPRPRPRLRRRDARWTTAKTAATTMAEASGRPRRADARAQLPVRALSPRSRSAAMSTAMTKLGPLLRLSAAVALAQTAAAAALGAYADEGDGDGSKSGSGAAAGSDLDGDTERLLMASMTLLLGACFAAFGTLMGYFSRMEDALLGRYAAEGMEARGVVTQSDLVRGRRSAMAGNGDVEAEYLVLVDYDAVLMDTYCARMRRAVKVRGVDVAWDTDTAIDAHCARGAAIDDQYDHANSNALDGARQPRAYSDHGGNAAGAGAGAGADAASYSNSDATLGAKVGVGVGVGVGVIHNLPPPHHAPPSPPDHPDLGALDMLVLPGKPRSGYPAALVRRKRTWRYRLATAAMVLSSLLIAVACGFVPLLLFSACTPFSFSSSTSSLSSSSSSTSSSSSSSLLTYMSTIPLAAQLSVAMYLFLLVIGLPLACRRLDMSFESTLREEYLEGGEFKPDAMHRSDESTISSFSTYYCRSTRGGGNAKKEYCAAGHVDDVGNSTAIKTTTTAVADAIVAEGVGRTSSTPTTTMPATPMALSLATTMSGLGMSTSFISMV